MPKLKIRLQEESEGLRKYIVCLGPKQLGMVRCSYPNPYESYIFRNGSYVEARNTENIVSGIEWVIKTGLGIREAKPTREATFSRLHNLLQNNNHVLYDKRGHRGLRKAIRNKLGYASSVEVLDEPTCYVVIAIIDDELYALRTPDKYSHKPRWIRY